MNKMEQIIKDSDLATQVAPFGAWLKYCNAVLAALRAYMDEFINELEENSVSVFEDEYGEHGQKAVLIEDIKRIYKERYE